MAEDFSGQADLLRKQEERRKQMLQGDAPPMDPSVRGLQSWQPAATQAGAQVEPPRAGPTGFVGFGQQLGANVEASERMARQVGQAALESGEVGMLGSESGRAGLLQKALGKAAEVSPLDAALAGAAGGDYFGQLQAAYGPEAQAKRAADLAAAQAEARKAQEAQAGRGARARGRAIGGEEFMTEAERGMDPLTRETSRIRAIDAKRPRGQISTEEWANMHGMTLEQWIQGGKQPPY